MIVLQQSRLYILLAAVSGLLATIIGAFGAHGLKPHMTSDMMAVYQTGVQYQFYHTLALLFVGLYLSVCNTSSNINLKSKSLVWSARLFIMGIVLFSGSLYLLAVTGIKYLGMITPVGGVCFILGWLFVFKACLKQPE